MNRHIRIGVAAVTFLLLAAACGQKAGVSLQSSGGAVDSGGDVGADVTGTEEAAGATDTVVADPGAVAGTPAAGGTTGGATTKTTVKAGTATTAKPGTATTVKAGPGATGPFTATANDKVGITDTDIVIGIHAPITGAAAIPNTSLERGKEIYFKWLKDNKGGVFGKKNVKVIVVDDEFNPVKAREVCTSLVEKDKVFMLIGAAGADQITACASYAESVGVPYLSAGVNESILSTKKTYFAISMTYSQQSPLIAQYIKNKVGLTKVGIVVADTRSFDDARASFAKAAAAAGLQVVYNEKINKDASAGEASSAMLALKGAGAEVVYLLSSPNVFINMAAAGSGQAYKPQFIGPGNTSGLNLVTSAACPHVDKAIFFANHPQLDAIDSMDPNFSPAYQKYGGAAGDDFGIQFWTMEKALHVMWEAAGPTMGRASFMNTLVSGKEFVNGVGPATKFAVGKPFGASQSHVLQADCAARQFKTVARFATGF